MNTFTLHAYLFRTLLVSMESQSSRQQLDCLSKWINSTAELRIAGRLINVGVKKVSIIYKRVEWYINVFQTLALHKI